MIVATASEEQRRMKTYLAIGGAGFLGAITRYIIATLSARLFGTSFPVGTLIINITGSLALGWILSVAGDKLIASEAMRLAVAVGFLGAYTTFSTFAFESDALIQDGQWLKSACYVAASVVLSLCAVRAGFSMGSR